MDRQERTTRFNEVTNPSTSRRMHPASSRPFVPMSIEELSLVRDLTYWTNTNVRAIGYLIDKDTHLILRSCSEVAGRFEIIVDVSLMETIPPLGTVIQLFGEIYLSKSTVPYITGCLYRNFEMVDLVRYNRALETISSLFPLHIRRSARKRKNENDEMEVPEH